MKYAYEHIHTYELCYVLDPATGTNTMAVQASIALFNFFQVENHE